MIIPTKTKQAALSVLLAITLINCQTQNSTLGNKSFRPELLKQLPPTDTSAPIDAINKFDDRIASKLKDVIAHLPTAHQEAISDCMQNTDNSKTLTDPECFINSFSTKIKDGMVKAINYVLTNKSKEVRNSIGLLN
jgi:hypothetical protein